MRDPEEEPSLVQLAIEKANSRTFGRAGSTNWLSIKMTTLRLVGATQEEMEAVGRIYNTCVNLLGYCDSDIADQMYYEWFKENMPECSRDGQKIPE